jgi:hypothetical protein
MEKPERHLPVAAIFIPLAVIAVIAAFFLFRSFGGAPANSPYYAVLLDNGSVYFGKLDTANLKGLSNDFPVLTEVYYVQTATNPETKQTNSILVKRGKEWHAPDRMVINARHIVFLEPVSPDSQVAKLIAQSKSQ